MAWGFEAASERDLSMLSYWDRTVQFIYDEYYVPKGEIVGEITAGLVVALAVVPEAIAFALVVGILPQTGINTTLITSIVVGVFGDRPGLCNGAIRLNSTSYYGCECSMQR